MRASPSYERLYYDVLKRIARDYMTPDQLRRDADKVGLEYADYLEMSYENVKGEAERAVRGKRRPRAAGEAVPASKEGT